VTRVLPFGLPSRGNDLGLPLEFPPTRGAKGRQRRCDPPAVFSLFSVALIVIVRP
jgi:hypothetical protein